MNWNIYFHGHSINLYTVCFLFCQKFQGMSCSFSSCSRIFHSSEQVATNDQFFSDLVIFRLWPQNWFLTPPANPVKFFWLEMPSNYVPLIVLQVSTSNRTYRGSLRPLKGQKWPKNHFFGHFWVCFVWFRKFSRIPIEKREKWGLRKSCSSFRSPDRSSVVCFY